MIVIKNHSSCNGGPRSHSSLLMTPLPRPHSSPLTRERPIYHIPYINAIIIKETRVKDFPQELKELRNVLYMLAEIKNSVYIRWRQCGHSAFHTVETCNAQALAVVSSRVSLRDSRGDDAIIGIQFRGNIAKRAAGACIDRYDNCNDVQRKIRSHTNEYDVGDPCCCCPYGSCMSVIPTNHPTLSAIARISSALKPIWGLYRISP